MEKDIEKEKKLHPDPWESIIQNPRPRPELTEAKSEALRDYYEGKAIPLDPDKMK
jgi:hypothetical protein